MIDLSNLYANMTHVCQEASLAELETMLSVIGNTLGLRFESASVLCFRAAQELHDYRRGKLRPRNVPHDATPPPRACEEGDEGGEA